MASYEVGRKGLNILIAATGWMRSLKKDQIKKLSPKAKKLFEVTKEYHENDGAY